MGNKVFLHLKTKHNEPNTTNDDITANNIDIDDNNNIISISTIEINIFPNPTQNFVTIDISKTEDTGNKTIKLFNLLGSQIREIRTIEGQYQYQFNLADLASSTYLVQVVENGQIIGSGKIIKIE